MSILFNSALKLLPVAAVILLTSCADGTRPDSDSSDQTTTQTETSVNDEIQANLATINANNPVLISMADMNAITEDAIIIRNAIADAISYSSLMDNEQIAMHLQNYRTQTIRLRNIMEFELFDEELERLTDEAILSVGGKLDAYQRMFDEEVNSKDLDRQFDAAKYIFNRTEKFDEKAGILTEEIMKNVIISQSNPNNP